MNIASGEVTALALCWRLVRRDGAALGFTTHDRDLAIGGLVYRAAPGMLPSAIAQGEGLEVDSLDVAGALTADAITAGDLAAGRWDGARVKVFAVDWEWPDGETIALARGELGAVSAAGAKFEAELHGPPQCSTRRCARRPARNAGRCWATRGAGWIWPAASYARSSRRATGTG